MIRIKVLILFVAIFLLVGQTVASILINQSAFPKTVNEGYANFSDWNLNEEPTRTLTGDWELYPNQLLWPTDFINRGSVDGKQFIPVPSGWGSTYGNHLMNRRGYATYRVFVQLPSQYEQQYAIKTNAILVSHRLFVNGELINQLGTPSNTYDTYDQRNVPQVSIIYPHTDLLEIIIQVANFDFQHGGIMQQIEIGKTESIQKEQYVSKGLSFTVILSFIVFSIYMFVIYFRIKNFSGIIYLASFFLFYAIFSLFSWDRLLVQYFDGIPYEYAFKIRDSLMMIALILMGLFTAQVVPRINAVIIVFVWIFGALTVGILFLPISMITNVYPIMSILIQAFHLYILVISIARLDQIDFFGPKPRVKLFFIILIILFNVIAIDTVLYSLAMIDEMLVHHISSLLFVGIVILLFIERFVHADRQQQELNFDLERANIQKEADLFRLSNQIKAPIYGVSYSLRNLQTDSDSRFVVSQMMNQLQSFLKNVSSQTNETIQLMDPQWQHERISIYCEDGKRQNEFSEFLSYLPFQIKVYPNVFSMRERLYAETLPSLILIDQHGIDQTILFEQVRSIRRSFSMLELPILVVASKEQPQTDIDLRTLGVNAVISYPLEAEDTRSKLESALTIRKLMFQLNRNEFAAMQAHMNPNFLGSVLQKMIDVFQFHATEAREMLALFSKFLRMLFKQIQLRDSVPISDEYQLVDTYIRLLNFTLNEPVLFEMELDPKFRNEAVLAHVLLPLVAQLSDQLKHVPKLLQSKLVIGKLDRGYRIVVRINGLGQMSESTIALNQLIVQLDVSQIQHRVEMFAGRFEMIHESKDQASIRFDCYVPTFEQERNER